MTASNSLIFLVNKFLVTSSIEDNDINYSIKKVDDLKNMGSRNSNIRSIEQVIKTPRRSVIPKSKQQSEYLKTLLNEDIVISLGPAGTGKSYLAVSVAVNMLMEKKVEKVILSRPAVEAGERLGFLPGDMKEKVDPYLQPLYDALYDLFGYEKQGSWSSGPFGDEKISTSYLKNFSFFSFFYIFDVLNKKKI